MENVTRQLKKAKTWNMVLLVLTGISAVTSLRDIKSEKGNL